MHSHTNWRSEPLQAELFLSCKFANLKVCIFATTKSIMVMMLDVLNVIIGKTVTHATGVVFRATASWNHYVLQLPHGNPVCCSVHPPLSPFSPMSPPTPIPQEQEEKMLKWRAPVLQPSPALANCCHTSRAASAFNHCILSRLTCFRQNWIFLFWLAQ